MKPSVYLAGSIRDNIPEDIAWRERAIKRLGDYATVLNPLAGKTFNETTGAWQLYGFTSPDSKYIVHADFWCVDRADIILFDFRSLAEGYPSLGTMTEFGRSTVRSILRLAIIPEDFKGHENTRHFKGLHPFLEQNVAKVFQGTDDAIEFTRAFCIATTYDPKFGGIVRGGIVK